jgi:UDP-N-acetylmuramate dehydrogenase
MLNKIATLVSNQGYTGFEWATGIPGTIGGSVVGNAGAYLKSISDLLISAKVYDGEKIYEMSNEDFKYEYRNSILKGNHNFVILSCTFKLEKGNIDDIKALIFSFFLLLLFNKISTHSVIILISACSHVFVPI